MLCTFNCDSMNQNHDEDFREVQHCGSPPAGHESKTLGEACFSRSYILPYYRPDLTNSWSARGVFASLSYHFTLKDTTSDISNVADKLMSPQSRFTLCQ